MFICKEAGADFVKTSTGFSKGGATAPDVALMKFVVGINCMLRPQVVFDLMRMQMR